MDIFGVNIPLWFLSICLLMILFYKYSISTFGTFKQMNVPGPKPVPLLGTMLPTFKLGIRERHKMLVEEFGKIIGTYMGRRPALIIADPDMLKQILVKDFSNFTNRYRQAFNGYPMDKMLNVLENEHWKHVRNHLTPTFSGSKLRRMVSLINKCCNTLVANLREPAKAGDMFECLEYCGSYTLDVIASTAFSLDVDAQKDKNNKFVRMARKMVDIKLTNPVVLIFFFLPSLTPLLRKFGLSFFPKDSVAFFVDTVNRAIKEREENPDEIPKDFLQLMLNSHIEDLDEDDADKDESDQVMVGPSGVWSKSGLTHEEVLGQSLIFLFAGYSTSSSALSLVMYNLAINPECQEKAYQEILDVVGTTNDPTYDAMKKMSYLEMCVEETLRIYPVASTTDRVTSEDYDIGGIHIPAGMTITIPIYILQNDPDVWPEPDKFKPERFTPEEKEHRHQFQYMPFGLGPRNCVGMRLAMLELKMALVHILRNFKLMPSEKTEVPLKLKKIQTEPENGNWLKAEVRV